MSVPGEEQQLRIDPTVRRVLVYRLGSLGDTLVALPSLHLVAKAFPNAERRMLTNVPVASRAPAAAAVLGDSGLIHAYERYPVGLRNPLELLKLLIRLRKFGPDVVVYLRATRDAAVVERDAKFLRLTGARRIVGLPRAEELRIPQLEADGCYEPEAKRLTRCIADLGDVDLGDAAAWDLRISSREQLRSEQAMGPLHGYPFFAVSVGTKVQSKDWGVPNWRALLRQVAEMFPGHGLLLAGAPEEKAASEEAASEFRMVPNAGPVVNLCGELSPRESAASFRGAVAFLGHDSGPMHLAAVMQTPTVAIFAARNKPRVWFPVSAPYRVVYHRVDCWGCGLETCVEQRKKCVLSITTQEVMEALKNLLETNGKDQAGSSLGMETGAVPVAEGSDAA